MADREAELEQQVTDGWTYLAEHAEDSADPAAPDQLARARGGIAWALLELGRLTESQAVAEGLIAYCEAAGDAVDDEWLAYALRLKHSSLSRQHRPAEAAAVDAEMIVRLRDSADPEVRRHVVTAMANRSRDLLDRPGQAAQGVAATDELLELIATEPDASVLALAGDLSEHMAALMNGGPGVGGYAAAALTGLLANAATLAGSALARVPSRTRARLPGRSWVAAVDAALVPPAVQRLRLRLPQARRVGEALIERLGALDDPDAGPLLARVELYVAACAGFMGAFLEATGRMDALVSRQDPDVAAAFEHAVDNIDDPRTLISRIIAVGTLARRAEALVGDDPALVRIAFEDSVAAKIPGAERWPLRWVVALLKPGG